MARSFTCRKPRAMATRRRAPLNHREVVRSKSARPPHGLVTPRGSRISTQACSPAMTDLRTPCEFPTAAAVPSPSLDFTVTLCEACQWGPVSHRPHGGNTVAPSCKERLLYGEGGTIDEAQNPYR